MEHEIGLLNHGRILRLSALKFSSQVLLHYEGRSYTYGRINSEVNGVAAALQSDGIRTGDRVVIMSENTPQYLRLIFALAKIGAVAVPINTMLPATAISDVLTRAKPRAAYVSAHHKEAFGEAHRRLPEGLRPDLWDLEADMRAECVDPELPVGSDDKTTTGSALGRAIATPVEPSPHRTVRDEDAAVILFSSGSTGNPTGIVKSFANLAWSAINRQLAEPRASGDREYFCLPLAGIAFANFVLTDVLTGATCVIARRFEASQAARDLAEQKITHVFLAPTMIRAISEAAPAERFDSVRRVESSFEFPLDLRKRARVMFPAAEILWSFGSTEATMARTPPEVFLVDTSCVGFASGLDEYRVMLHGSDAVGEIESRGPTRMLGYLADFDSSSPSRPEEWFATGDLGEMDDQGRLHFRGRVKDMIKSGGANVFARDVEEVLVQVPGVLDAAVVGVPDDYWGEAVTAILELSPEVDLSLVSEHVRTRLAPYQRPKSFYVTNDLPKNPTGKHAKGVIREMIDNGQLQELQMQFGGE
jgi:acyl-CoA synthetase (AMP-forming)/AMP-acid ligase II